MDGRSIGLRAIGRLDPAILEALRDPLARRFSAAVTLDQPIALRPDWLDAGRGQYRADRILDALIALPTPKDRWTLGIADQDLFAPGLRFVFGQATVDGCCGVIGLARLRPEFHHMPPDEEIFRRRTLTEAVHELGHVAGRNHCPDPRCVMHFSNSLEDTDLKSTDFCRRCAPTP